MIENFEKVKSPDILIEIFSAESRNSNASPDISDCQTNTIYLEKPLIHDARYKDSPNVLVKSWTLINSESNKCIDVTKQSFNSDEHAIINKNADTPNSSDCIYDEAKGLFNQTIELINNIITDISDKEFNMHVKVWWNKRTDAFKFTPDNYKLQNLIWNKTKMQLSSLKSIKILKQRLVMIYQSTKENLLIRYFNLIYK